MLVGDFIAQKIRERNFETRAVGIEIMVPNQDTSRIVRNEVSLEWVNEMITLDD